MPKKKAVRHKAPLNISPELTDIEADLLRHMQQGYDVETSSLEHGPLLRNRKTVVRPTSANLNTVKALQERGLIHPVKGRDPLTTVWHAISTGKKISNSR